MNSKSMIVVGALVIIGGFLFISSDKTPSDLLVVSNQTNIEDENALTIEELSNQDVTDESMMNDVDDTMKSGSATMEDSTHVGGENVMAESGIYAAYSPEKLAFAQNGDVVLYFKASWCPSCRALDADITKNIHEIPETVAILILDYDKELELRKKYGVTTQHTLVQVDASGELIAKWSGSPTLAHVVSRIQ